MSYIYKHSGISTFHKVHLVWFDVLWNFPRCYFFLFHYHHHWHYHHHLHHQYHWRFIFMHNLSPPVPVLLIYSLHAHRSQQHLNQTKLCQHLPPFLRPTFPFSLSLLGWICPRFKYSLHQQSTYLVTTCYKNKVRFTRACWHSARLRLLFYFPHL